MKKNAFKLMAISFLVATSVPILAQEDNVQKVKVNVEITKDGKTETIVKEYDVSAAGDMVWEFDEDTDGKREIIIHKTFNSADDLPWMGPPEDSKMSTSAFLGVVGYTMNENGGGEKRVRITKVIEGEAAAKAGLKNEDIIETIDGKPLQTYEQLVDVIRNKKPSDDLKMKVLRDGKSEVINATLGEKNVKRYHHCKILEGAENVEIRLTHGSAMTAEDKQAIKNATGVSPSDVNSFNEVSMELYPNPSADKFRYKLKIDEGGQLERTLISPQGEVIETKNLKSKDGVYEGEVNLDDKPAGNYILLFKRGDKIITEKLMKQ